MGNRVLYRQDRLPIFQNRMYETAEAGIGCPHGDIRLVQDDATGLVYNEAFRPELMIYDEHYQNEQSVSEPFRVHLNEIARLVLRELGNSELIEVGCGKGFFLQLMRGQGAQITGFDPTYEGNDPAIRKTYFNAAQQMAGKGMVLRHVLEHVPDPFAFLTAIKVANGGGGLIYIEVPCLDWIIDNRAWFDSYYEHVNYFRKSDFHRMFGRVVHAENTFGGQYLSIVADLATLRVPAAHTEGRVDLPNDFMLSIPSTEVQGATVWGGASKGVIFALLCERAGHPVAQVIDINPAKQGKYIAATGLRIKSPAEALAGLAAESPIYVMNSNYLAEIKEISNHLYNYIEV